MRTISAHTLILQRGGRWPGRARPVSGVVSWPSHLGRRYGVWLAFVQDSGDASSRQHRVVTRRRAQRFSRRCRAPAGCRGGCHAEPAPARQPIRRTVPKDQRSRPSPASRPLLRLHNRGHDDFAGRRAGRPSWPSATPGGSLPSLCPSPSCSPRSVSWPTTRGTGRCSRPGGTTTWPEWCLPTYASAWATAGGSSASICTRRSPPAIAAASAELVLVRTPPVPRPSVCAGGSCDAASLSPRDRPGSIPAQASRQAGPGPPARVVR